MSINPADYVFTFDKICLSFLDNFEDEIKKNLLEQKEKASRLAHEIRANFNLYSVSKRNYYDEYKELIDNSPLEHFLGKIKINCFDVIGSLDYNEEVKKIKKIKEEIITSSKDIVSIKHFIYNDKSNYYGEGKDNTKEGFGLLEFSSNTVYIGRFEKDNFVDGIILKENIKSIYKGKFDSKTNTIRGMKFNQTENANEYFFGEINAATKTNNGCLIKFSSKKDSKKVITINYYHDNKISLKLEYLDSYRKIALVLKENVILQYQSNKYLVEYNGSEKIKNKALIFKVFRAFYYGNLCNESFLPQGKGIILYENKDIFIGPLKEGKKEGEEKDQEEGFGRYFNFDQKRIYEGLFKNDLLQAGEIMNGLTDRVIFSGTYDKGNIVSGKQYYFNFDVYDGNYKDGKRDGNGVYTFHSLEGKDITVGAVWHEGVKRGTGFIKDNDNFKQYEVEFNEKGNLNKVYDKDNNSNEASK